MKHKSIRRVLSVLLALCAFLPSFSLLSSAAELNASAYSISTSLTGYYFTDYNGICEELYSDEYTATYSDFPFDLTYDYSYPDSNRIATLLKMRVTFTDDFKYYGTNYRLSFNLDKPLAAHFIYFYGMTVPESFSYIDSSGNSISGNNVVSLADFAITLPFSLLGVGDNVKNAGTFNNEIKNSLISTFGNEVFDYITTADGYFGSSKPFSVDLYIPADQAVIHKFDIQNGVFSASQPYPRTIDFYFLIFKQTDSVVDSLTLSDISLTPIKGTEEYYQDEIFQNDVIGSDEEGEESGLKGIIAFLKSIPGTIYEYFARFYSVIMGSDEEGSESGILGILAFIKKLPTMIIDKLKELFIPSDGYFDQVYEDVDLFLSDHLGFLYQFLTFIEDFLSFFMDAISNSYDKASSYLYFPPATVYISSDPPEGQSFILSNIATDFGTSLDADLSNYTAFNIIPDNSIGNDPEGYYFRFSFLLQAPFSFIYDVYYIASYAIVTLLFIYHWYNRIRGVLGVS